MEQILAFQIEEGEVKKIKEIANRMKAAFRVVEQRAYRQTIGDLLEQRQNFLVQDYTENQIKGSMIVMEGFREKRLDMLLKLLRDKGVRVDYKAVVTPFNRKWNVLQLYLEMERERAAYGKRG